MCPALSVKTRLSLIISVLVSVMLVLNVFINDHFIRRELNSQTTMFSETVGKHTSALVEEFLDGREKEREKAATILRHAVVQAASLVGKDDTQASLKQAAKLTGAEKLELLKPVSGGYQIVASSDARRIGQLALGRSDLPVEWTLGPPASGQRYLMKDTFSDGGKAPVSWGYYTDSEHPYIIALTIYTHGYSPDTLIDQVRIYQPEVLEIGIWSLSGQKGADAGALKYGSEQYASDPRGMELLKLAEAGRAQSEQAVIGGKSVLRSWYPFQEAQNNSYVISVVVDRTQIESLSSMHRRNQISSSLLILAATLIGTWIIIQLLLRPLKGILHKVNEVAFGRFDRDIEVKRSDEIGELASRINHMSGSLKSYTDKLKAAVNENALMKEELESIFNNTADSIVIIGLDGNLLRVNESFLHTFGYSPADISTLRITDVVHPVEHAYRNPELARMLQGEALPPGEEKWRHKDGDYLMVGVTMSAVRNSQGEVWSLVAVARDVTSRAKMEELLRQSEKLTTVGQLAAGVAHEIRNPLTTLRGFLQLQQQSGRLNLQHNDIMLAELDRINLIVSEFLILAKPQAAKFEIKDVRYTLGDVISLLDSEGHLKNAVFHTRFTKDSCLISCEENQLKQVFINVIKNAIEAMPQGGNVYFDIQREEPHSVSVRITDEGIGIPEDIIPKIGNPFFTGKETGTGLGIMVSQRIIQSHKGRMEIQSKLGQGTSILITLPMSPDRRSGGDGAAS